MPYVCVLIVPEGSSIEEVKETLERQGIHILKDSIRVVPEGMYANYVFVPKPVLHQRSGSS